MLNLSFWSFFCRKKCSRPIKLGKSIRPSLTAQRICQAWPISMTLVSCGTPWLGTSMNWSTPTQVSSVSPSILTNVSPSILNAPWRFTLEREGKGSSINDVTQIRRLSDPQSLCITKLPVLLRHSVKKLLTPSPYLRDMFHEQPLACCENRWQKRTNNYFSKVASYC